MADMGPAARLVLILLLGQAAALPATQTGNAEQQCTGTAYLDLDGAVGAPTRITAARLVTVPAAGLESPPNRASGFGRPIRGGLRVRQYCAVTGYVAPQNKFELRLPLPADWNHNYFFAACGGFCGTVNGALCAPALERGYASVTTNGGHDSAAGFDGAWAAGAPNLQEDFAWRGTHLVTLATKAIVARFYGESIRRSYMSGCSKGGQAVLMEAQRFPEDYDGLMPVAPVYDYTGRSVVAAAWFAQAVTDGHGGSVLTPGAVDVVHRSVLQHCGGKGADEGLVTDPRRCAWSPSMVACPSGVLREDCLTPTQVHAIDRLMTSPANSRGDVIYRYPYLPGTETEWAGWNFAAIRAGRLIPEFGNFKVADQYLKYLADAAVRAHVDVLRFDFDRDPATLTRARALYDATSPNLLAFKARGGKLLLWHGLADSGIAATSSVGYYESVVDALGGRAQVDDFFRMFLIPGVHHCGGGPGLVEFDAFSALEDWVERGRPPDRLMASRVDGGSPRPLFPAGASRR